MVVSIRWVAIIALLAGYILLSSGIVIVSGFLYQFLNLIGAALLVWTSYKIKDWPVMILNTIWAGIAIYFLIKIYL